ncbi:MAG: DivIVA domain-containing protein [Candidatus Aquicultorales bacterium]
MKLTPLDIHHKEFHRAIRGYNEEEVDDFLDQVAEEFERLFKENIDLKEQIEKHKEKSTQFEQLQQTLQNALITAQKSADEVIASARKEAEQVVRDAEDQAQGMLRDAYQGKDRLEDRFKDLREAENEFRSNFKKMLESYVKLVEGEMPRPRTSYVFEEKPEPKQEPAEPRETPAEAEEASFEKQAEAEISMEGETPVEPAETEEPVVIEPEEERKSEERDFGEQPSAFSGDQAPAGGTGGAPESQAPSFPYDNEPLGLGAPAAPAEPEPQFGTVRDFPDLGTSTEVEEAPQQLPNPVVQPQEELKNVNWDEEPEEKKE